MNYGKMAYNALGEVNAKLAAVSAQAHVYRGVSTNIEQVSAKYQYVAEIKIRANIATSLAIKCKVVVSSDCKIDLKLGEAVIVSDAPSECEHTVQVSGGTYVVGVEVSFNGVFKITQLSIDVFGNGIVEERDEYAFAAGTDGVRTIVLKKTRTGVDVLDEGTTYLTSIAGAEKFDVFYDGSDIMIFYTDAFRRLYLLQLSSSGQMVYRHIPIAENVTDVSCSQVLHGDYSGIVVYVRGSKAYYRALLKQNGYEPLPEILLDRVSVSKVRLAKQSFPLALAAVAGGGAVSLYTFRQDFKNDSRSVLVIEIKTRMEVADV